MLDQATAHVPVNLPVNAAGVPNGKVVRPPFQVPIQLSNQARDRLEALVTIRHFVQLLPLPLDRLFDGIIFRYFWSRPFRSRSYRNVYPRKSRLAPSSLKSTTRVFSRLISNWNFPSSRDSMYSIVSEPICFAIATKSSA